MDSDTITLTRTDYEDLIDARDHAQAMREVATGAMETLGEAELDAYFAAPSPLAFWRKRRGLTEADLARAAGITEGDLAPIEHGSHGGDVAVFARLARALRVRIEDLLPAN